jgi:peptidoglycan/LPS O-acetylase OafA/YrhL
VLSLAEIKSHANFCAMDRLAGELSYPIYLLHTTVGAWFLPQFGFGRSFTFFAVSFAATLPAAWFMLLLVDRLLRRLRFELRPIRAKHPVTKTESYQIHTGRQTVP